MTLGGPAGEGGHTDAPTVPLAEGSNDGVEAERRRQPTQPMGIPRRTPRPRLPRWLRRFLIVVMTLALAATVTFTTLLLVTPSVSNAPALARSFDLAHHAVYPGPPVPARFAAARVLRGRMTSQPDQGGATLYQQLAKMLYTSGRSGVSVEVEQMVLGIKLELSYSKAEILRLYADIAYFGHGYYGLAAASCGYFGVTPAGLSWPQAALLAGLVQAPSADNPIAHYHVARAREAHVLGRLAATGKLTQTQAGRAYKQPLHLVVGPGTGCTAG